MEKIEKIDLVYILGKGSKWSDNEIRFSLRSIEKYFDYRKIFIIGEKPESLLESRIYRHMIHFQTNY